MKVLISSLAEAVESEPQGLRPSQILQQIVAACLRAISGSEDEDKLAEFAESSAAAARAMRPDLESDDLWRAWYAGQVQTVASLCRLLLRLEIPASVKRKILTPNNASILLALSREDDLTQSELRARTGIVDPSQFSSKHVAPLQAMRVVDVAREGRNSWVRLTSMGRRILAAPAIREKLERLARRTSREPVAAAAAAAARDPSVAAEADQPRGIPNSPPGAMVGGEDDTLRLHLLRVTPPVAVSPRVYAPDERPKAKVKRPRAIAPDSLVR